MSQFLKAAVFAVALIGAASGYSRAGESLSPASAVAVAFLNVQPADVAAGGAADLSAAVPPKKAGCAGGCEACECAPGKCPLGCPPAAVQFADCPNGKCAPGSAPAFGTYYLPGTPAGKQVCGPNGCATVQPAAGSVYPPGVVSAVYASGSNGSSPAACASAGATAGPVRGFFQRIRDRLVSRRGGRGCSSCGG